MPSVSYFQAAERVQLYIRALTEQAHLRPQSRQTETVSLAVSSGRILAQPMHADRDQPPWPRATRDGFACRAADANARQPLRIVAQIRAGQTSSGTLAPGEACEIMTGAPVPDGADAVFMLEHALLDANSVRLAPPRTIAPGENIVPQAAEAQLGDLLIPAGTPIAAPQIALAAQCGLSQLSVWPRPRVAILATGDELVPVDAAPGPSQIRNSNSPMLAALAAAAGGEPLVFPAVPDREIEMAQAIDSALNSSPALLLITGGISAGKFDLVADALICRNARFLFQSVAIQPGKPVAFAEIPVAGAGPTPTFALPGNPISSAVTFHLFAAPILAALAGSSSPQPRFARARLTEEWRGKPGLTRFLPAACDFALEPQVWLIPWQGSGDLAAFARSNCFLVVPADADRIPAGSMVQILLS
jgi:molybdopterin molybdotransferase